MFFLHVCLLVYLFIIKKKRGDIKIFDLGLAKLLPISSKPGSTYNYTAMCGTPRYMAPEVGLGKPYNELCDVYSLGILFWEILTFERPFVNYKTLNQFTNNVWKGSYSIRPIIPKKTSKVVRSLLERSWSNDLKIRPSAAQFENELQTELLTHDKNIRVTHTRRSTFLLIKGKGEVINTSSRTVQSSSSSSSKRNNNNNNMPTLAEDGEEE